MSNAIESIIQITFSRSNEGSIHFGQVVEALLAAGVESYWVDYRACRATYYLPSGQTHSLGMDAPEAGIDRPFSAPAIQAAIRAAQQGEVLYPEFKRRSQAAGCIGYMAWLQGRHVSYFGRNGETHIERFPD
ncbi:hypothetical protein [Pseudomonas peli]|uniref:hypothetical protein n=1 Tax=Pseudomonas peli TaxID=592361 RepID=UPI003D3241FB